MKPDVAKVFTSPHILPLAYVKILEDWFGLAWLEWEPETLWASIKDEISGDLMRDLGDSRIPDGIKSKILATRIFLTTTFFYEDAKVFENIVLAVNDLGFEIDQLELVAPEEMVYALRALLPLRDDKPEWSRQVIGYIRTCCRREGLLKYPETLAFAQPEVTEPEIRDKMKQITARYIETPSVYDMVDVQCMKLFNITQYTVHKNSKMSAAILT